MDIYTTNLDLTGCLISEKVDGVQATWDGESLCSRDGHRLAAPDWFLAALPEHPTRGELWAGRGRFEDVLSVVNSPTAGDRWRQIRFVDFDTVPRWPAESPEHVESELQRIVDLGGEGLVLRTPGGTDYKYTPISDDDAEVVGHAEGTGRNKGRCGALLVRDRDGRKFRLGTGLDDASRRNPPRVGTIVKYTYQGRTKRGLPRFASYLGTRAERTMP
jgi:DNA ligase-1